MIMISPLVSEVKIDEISLIISIVFHSYHGYVAAVHGPHVAAAVFILQMKGGFR